jgi:GNAT superfamily N-acetyltransferase
MWEEQRYQHMMFNEQKPITIRLASQDDAKQMAYLCEQLGYPVSGEQLKSRLATLLPHRDHALFVAERPGEPLLGWIHISRCLLLHTDPEAQIGGLVVDAGVRRSGAGQRLLQAAEQWARKQGCWAIYLRSHVTRTDAHQFYHTMGYETVTSSVFRKRL